MPHAFHCVGHMVDRTEYQEVHRPIVAVAVAQRQRVSTRGLKVVVIEDMGFVVDTSGVGRFIFLARVRDELQRVRQQRALDDHLAVRKQAEHSRCGRLRRYREMHDVGEKRVAAAQ
jgi:hypothetical protein